MSAVSAAEHPLTGWRFALATVRRRENTSFKIGLNFVVPFIVSNLGVIGGTGTART